MTETKEHDKDAPAASVSNRLLDGAFGKWQPIETAPKDGTWILVFGVRYTDEHLPPFGFTRWIHESREEWMQTNATTRKLQVTDHSHWDYETGMTPTHWMPLPPEPEAV